MCKCKPLPPPENLLFVHAGPSRNLMIHGLNEIPGQARDDGISKVASYFSKFYLFYVIPTGFIGISTQWVLIIFNSITIYKKYSFFVILPGWSDTTHPWSEPSVPARAGIPPARPSSYRQQSDFALRKASRAASAFVARGDFSCASPQQPAL